MDRGSKRKRVVIYGKEPKEPSESTEEMRQRERERQAKSRGGTSESEEMNRKKGGDSNEK